MFKMLERPRTVTFSHLGKEYTMTKEEIEAAYRYQQSAYALEDAARNFDAFVFGWNADPDALDAKDKIEDFEAEYGVGYSAACAHLKDMEERFFDKYDCGQSEDDMWVDAIEYVLKSLKEAGNRT